MARLGRNLIRAETSSISVLSLGKWRRPPVRTPHRLQIVQDARGKVVSVKAHPQSSHSDHLLGGAGFFFYLILRLILAVIHRLERWIACLDVRAAVLKRLSSALAY